MSRLAFLRGIALSLVLTAISAPSVLLAQDGTDNTGRVQGSVDRLTFSASALSGVQGTHSNTMAIGSVTFPVTTLLSGQLDLGLGKYRSDYSSNVAAARVFWRYQDRGAVGFYFDYANLNPEHSGRFAIEGSYYFDRVTVDALIGFRTGTNVYTAGFDEIDVSYYITDDFKASVGHRGTSRGNVANVGFEYAPDALGGWTLFGEAEAGDDDNQSAYAGVRYTLGGGRYESLIDRDRNGPMRIRAPRGLVDNTRCGSLPDKQSATFGLHEMSVLCASEDELEDEGADEEKKTKEKK